MAESNSDSLLVTEVASLVEESLEVRLSEPSLIEVKEGNGGTLKAFFAASAEQLQFTAFVKARRSPGIHKALWYTFDQKMLAREYHVYHLLKRLRVPHARIIASRYQEPTRWTLVLEDLRSGYVLPKSDNQLLSEDAIESLLDTYVRIHSTCLHTGAINESAEGTWLQPEEGTQVDDRCGREIWETLSAASMTTRSVNPSQFAKSVEVLCKCRDTLLGCERTVAFNDFHVTNVAFPRANGPAVLFDWELAGAALPAFDIINLTYGREQIHDKIVSLYLSKMADTGIRIDRDVWRRGIAYARLSSAFYALWLLHMKLQADPDGRLPGWMRSESSELLSGKLISLTRKAGEIY